MGVEHFLPHRDYFVAQRGEVALLAQDRYAQRFELASDRPVAGLEAGAAERLMFPHPRLFRLIFPEALERTDQQAARAVRAQPEIGVIEHAGGGGAGKQGVDALREPRVVFRRLGRASS